MFLRAKAVGHVVGDLAARAAQFVRIHDTLAIGLVDPQVDVGGVGGPFDDDARAR
jgi:hypothetical protein